MKVLVVEDSELLALLFQEYLNAKGYNVAVRNNYSAGLAFALQENPEIIIADYTLPDGTGLDLIRKYQTLANFADTHFILTTGYDCTMLKKEFGDLDKNAVQILPKPFFMAELSVLLNKIPHVTAA